MCHQLVEGYQRHWQNVSIFIFEQDRDSTSFLPCIVGFVHESIQWAKSAIHNQFEITELALSRCKVPISLVMWHPSSCTERRTSVSTMSLSFAASSLSWLEIGSSRATRSLICHTRQTPWAWSKYVHTTHFQDSTMGYAGHFFVCKMQVRSPKDPSQRVF